MSESSFAIINYHDTKGIYRKVDILLSQPILPLKKAALDKYLRWWKLSH